MINRTFEIHNKAGIEGLAMKCIDNYFPVNTETILCSLCKMQGFERIGVNSDVLLMYVNPKQIQYVRDFSYIPNTGKNALVGYGVRGNWDKLHKDFKDCRTFRSMKMVFEDGAEWKDTPFYQRAINSKGQKHSYLKSKCNKWELMYESIKKTGYKKQKQLYSECGANNKSQFQIRTGDLLLPAEIRVAIGRDGEFIHLSDGQHRLSAAKISNFDGKVPAIIQFIHGNVNFKNIRGKSEVLDTSKPLVEEVKQ